MKDGNAITAMIQTHNAPQIREDYLAWAFFDKPQPYVPDFEEEMTVPKWFRLRIVISGLSWSCHVTEADCPHHWGKIHV